MTLMGLSFMTNAPKPKWLEVPIPSIVNVATVKDYGNMYNLCRWRRECQQCIGRQYKQYDALVEQKRVSRQAREIKDLMTLTVVVVITVLTLLMAVVELNTS
eukprot:scaffold39156_cov177-Skeletonema_marinoi.AAC.2